MVKLLSSGVFERLISQRLVTINEVVNSLYGLNPNTKTIDLPNEISEEAQDIKKIISRNIRSTGLHIGSVNTEIDADLIFAACIDYIREGITPPEIIGRVREAVMEFVYVNDWEKYIFAFGGRTLVDDIAKIRKTGRGQHRKTDEEAGTLKMMGLLIKLLAEKHPTQKYGTSEKPTISEIYKDILDVIQKENATAKGVGRSTFAAKAAIAIRTIHNF
ncbi:hypothetical protein [Yersinia enterocolitica]|uniref:hypothetical protein n=1 Tax=Yersinia enterocolitica TaxID=630 RepID=UPI001CA57A25|nr:hypothetical protein [Yersinia enterocolitica]MBW5869956.1 hypothetical protein [Yersinia enterocolitica]